MKSWRPGTKKQYAVYLKKWALFCGQHNIDILKPSIDDVLNFLTELVNLGLKYSALNTARGALSAAISSHERNSVGDHPLVKRFMKGVFEMYPPQPRYTTTWDISSVLDYLRSLSPVSDISLKDLSMKLTMLLALVSAQRIQTLQCLNINNLSMGHTCTFSFTEHLKHSRPGKKALVLELRPYIPDRNLCVITVLKEYLGKTLSLRKNESQLLISYAKPHLAVSRDTIARWLRTIMEKAGVNTAIYKPHSTRAAVTSKAARANVPIEDILKAAGWSTAGTFGKFYNKKVDIPSDFDNSVLSK